MENGGVNFDRCLLENPFVHQQSFTFEKRRLRCLLPRPPVFFSQFSFFTPPVQTPIRNHLHARKPADVDLAHHQLLLPWEPKQRNLSPACTHRLSHTFLTCLHSKQSRARAAEKASRQRLCPRGCRLSRATCTPTHFASFPSPEAQDRLTRDRVCVCCPVLRSGHVTHKPPRPLLCTTFCSAESRKWLHRVLL